MKNQENSSFEDVILSNICKVLKSLLVMTPIILCILGGIIAVSHIIKGAYISGIVFALLSVFFASLYCDDQR